MTADKDRDTYRTLTTLAVLLVATIAAVVSYMHVATLAMRYGQPRLAAYLLPVSIDGLVAVASLVMLRSARLGVSAPWLARSGLVLAVAATLGCNVAYGLPHGAPGALLSGWPAVAFVVSAEMAISMTRKRSPRGGHTTPDKSPAPAATAQRSTKRTAKRTSQADSHAAIMSALAANPDATRNQLALAAGVSARTVRRHLNGAATTT